jgi:hypothetical protein
MNGMRVVTVEKANGVNVKDIDGLEAMQSIVGGSIESVPFVHDVYIICNEEGKLLDLPPMLDMGHDVIHGDFFFMKVDGEGEHVDLTDKEISKIKKIIGA